MNKINLIFLIILISAGLILVSLASWHSGSGSEHRSSQPPSPTDTTPRVTGVGGIFFKSDDPKTLKAWYGRNLGLEINEYGSIFEFRNANRPDEINYLSWSPFSSKTSYFAPSKKDFMINYRVQNLPGLIRNLAAAGVTIVDTMETYDYGKFIHILDPEGNKIELWEPIDHVLTKLGGKTTK